MRQVTSLLVVLLCSILLAGCVNLAGNQNQPLTVGTLVMGDSRLAKMEGLQQGMQELGWDDKRVTYQVFNAQDNEQKLTQLAQKLVALRPNVLVVGGAVEAQAVMQAMRGGDHVPLVMIGVTSPLNTQLKQGFAALGIPVTGVDNGHVALTGKRMELLRLIFPQRTKLLLLYDPRLQASLLALQQAEAVAKDSAYQIQPIPVSDDKDLAALGRRIFAADEAMLTLPSYFLEARYRQISAISLAKRTPVMGLYDTEVAAGYTASYGVSYHDQGYQAARLVVRVLKGKADEIPFELPDSVQLKLNVAAAAKIGVTISPIGLSYGDKVDAIKE